MIRLELPSIKYKESYLKAVREIIERGAENESNEHYLRREYSKANTSKIDKLEHLKVGLKSIKR